MAFFFFSKQGFGNQLERLTSVGRDSQLQPGGWRTDRRGVIALRCGALEERSRKHLKTHKGQNSRVMNRDEKMPRG